jgi:hypothetical protein
MPGGGDPLLALQQKNRALFLKRMGTGGPVASGGTAYAMGGLGGG